MGAKLRKKYRFNLLLLLVFSTLYAASFLIADSYSYFTSEVEIAGEIITEEDFGNPIPLITEPEEEVVEEQEVKEEPQDKEEVELESSDKENSKVAEPVEPVSDEVNKESENETESELENSEETKETSEDEKSQDTSSQDSDTETEPETVDTDNEEGESTD